MLTFMVDTSHEFAIFNQEIAKNCHLIHNNTANTSIISTRYSSSLCNNSFRHTYSVYTEESHQFLHLQQIKTLCSYYFIQHQLMCSLKMDQ
jgi:hypothetical protein